MEDVYCPICVEAMDFTDLATALCSCNFKVCLWCYKRICEDDGAQARCPNCRTVYDQERIRQQQLDPKQLQEINKLKAKASDKKKLASAAKPRKELANMRVVQRNLVYVVGLALELCFEETLKGPDFFGQFGKIIKISVSKAGPYGSATAKNGPTGSAYVTYRGNEDARRCIEAVHGTEWEGKAVKACYGTTKYCNAFLKGTVCNNSDCLYLHGEANDEDSYTKEQTKSTKFVNLVHAASLSSAAAKAAAAAAAAAQAPRLASGNLTLHTSGSLSSLTGPADSLVSVLSSSPANSSAWAAAAGGGASWAAIAQTHQPAPAPQPALPPPPPAVDASAEEWPELPGAGGSGSDALSGIDKGLRALTRNGSTMAAQIAARPSGTPKTQQSAPAGDAASSKQAKLVPLSNARHHKAAASSQSDSPPPEEDVPSPIKEEAELVSSEHASAASDSVQEEPPSTEESPLAGPAGQPKRAGPEQTGAAAHKRELANGFAEAAAAPVSASSSSSQAHMPNGLLAHAFTARKGGPPPGFGAPSALQNGPTSSLSTPMPAPASSSFAPLDPSTPHSPSNMWATGSSPLSLGPLLEPYDPLATTPPARSQSRFRFAQADAAGGAAARHSTQAVLQQAAGADISLLSQKLQAMGAAGNPQLHHAGSGSQPLSPGALLLRQLHMGPTGARAGSNAEGQASSWYSNGSPLGAFAARSARSSLDAPTSAHYSHGSATSPTSSGQLRAMAQDLKGARAASWEAQVHGQQWQLDEQYGLPAAL